MKLIDYLKKHGISINEMARQLGVSTNFLWMCTKGMRKIPLDLAQDIVKLTNNECTIPELITPMPKKEKESNICECCGRRLPKNVKHT